jgi:nucleotide-binding universal stress UspA family protein
MRRRSQCLLNNLGRSYRERGHFVTTSEMTHKGDSMSEDTQKKIVHQQLKNILLATDFLESSRLALDYAVAFAHHYGAKLTIVHACELSPEAREAEMIHQKPSVSREHMLARLEALASGVRRLGISTETDLRDGEPRASVLTCAAENSADLLVLGTHGIYRGLEHAFIGSNAEKILLSASYPTFTVGRHVLAGIDLDLNFRKVLLVSDLSPESATAAKYAASLGQDLGLEIEILPVFPGGAHDSEKVREVVETYCADLRLRASSIQEWCNAAYLLKKMASTQQVIEQAMKCVDGLLILGVHGESAWKRHLHASFAFELIARSASPVISIHE